MNQPDFIPFSPEQAGELAELLASETWPFHSNPNPEKDKILNAVNEGSFSGEYVKTFWIVYQGEKSGIIRLFDLEDEIPLFDLRIRQKFRGRGLGEAALRWLVQYVFKDLGYR